MTEDPNYVVKLERAIKEKYGEEAIQNPKKSWNKEKEEKHEEQTKEFYKRKFFKDEKNPKQNYKGFLVSKKLLSRESNRECPVCENYSFSFDDDIYMLKFECCFDCYIQYVESREERWRSGWRPNVKEKTKNGNNTRDN